MSKDRKLQAEIARTLKKVEEGVVIFDNLYDRVQASETQSLKLKYEVDLKKELKKLQRMRESIKSWAGSSEVKDKKPLHAARKLIETKMEAFKICERETKTKAYSNDGLARAAQLGPEEQKRRATRQWVDSQISALKTLIEEAEADLEAASASTSRKKRRKKKHQPSEEEEEYQALIDQHQFHVDALEKILRLLDRKELECDEVENIKEDVEYYIETNRDDEAYDDPGIYDDLNLDNRSKTRESAVSTRSSTSSSDASSGGSETKSPPRKPVAKKVTGTPLAIGRGVSRKQAAAALDKIKEASGANDADSSSTSATSKSASAPSTGNAGNGKGKGEGSGAVGLGQVGKSVRSGGRAPAPQGSSQRADKRQPEATEEANRAASRAGPAPAAPRGADEPGPGNPVPGAGKREGGATAVDFNVQKQLLDAALTKLPQPSDSLRQGMLRHQPRNPFNTPSIFPNEPTSAITNPALFEKLEIDTLFFIFYFQQGSYQQYLAAQQLKKYSWRYHKKYKTWFQRHAEPKETTDEYEVGTYVYFDFETGWCQRIKSEFTFEYIYLEDELA